MTARERIILDLIKINITISCKNLDGYFFSPGVALFHPSIKLPIYTTIVGKSFITSAAEHRPEEQDDHGQGGED
jgi:hypothetical protein